MAATEDTSSSSNNKTTNPTIVEEEDDGPVEKKPAGNKLRVQHLVDFGFNLAIEANKNAAKWDGGKGGDGKDLTKAVAAVKRARSNKNQTVVYGADPDDADDDFNDDQDIYDEPGAILDDDSDEDGENGNEEEELYTGNANRPGYNYFDDYSEADDMWEDEDEDDNVEYDEEDEGELERQRQEAFEAAMLAAEEERERLREVRLAEIMKKKEVLIERYLKVARVMISHRKKNIYLQDYLYHLAQRKGVLRGDSFRGTSTMDSDESALSKAMKLRQQKKNSLMASRFGRFLRKTGHFYEDPDNHHHHHHHVTVAQTTHHHRHVSNKPSHSKNFHNHRKRHHHSQYSRTFVPKTMIRKNSKHCPDAEEGNCGLNKKTQAKLKKMLTQKHSHHTKKSDRNAGAKKLSNASKKTKPRTLAEKLERKAQLMLHKTLKTVTDALDHFESHRCKMAKKKQLIKITKLLERHYSGISLMEQERSHLVSFVETSVKAQNLAKRRAMKRQQKNKSQNKMGIVNQNHQWTKSLERIRELRLKKAKLEQEERLVLIRKVKHWNVWEKRNAAAIESVYDFVTEMASRVIMSKGETQTFRHGIDQFRKQLYTLHEAMLKQVINKHKAQNILFMAQRHAKDNTSVAAPVIGFTISDYERMVIENQESHQKLMERQEHLLVQYEKLKQYIKKVADFHLKKQRAWGSLRTGRHDMKQLWELCLQERDNLLRKLGEIQIVNRLHRRLFMQIAVVENKRLFKDFHQVNRRVEEMMDIERDLNTQLHQVQSLCRILNVKFLDTQMRHTEAEKQKADTTILKSLQHSKDTIRERIAPRVPNTVYNVNIGSFKSQVRILESEKQRLGLPKSGSKRK